MGSVFREADVRGEHRQPPAVCEDRSAVGHSQGGGVVGGAKYGLNEMVEEIHKIQDEHKFVGCWNKMAQVCDAVETETFAVVSH